MKKTLFILAALCVTLSSVHAQTTATTGDKSGWKKIGELHVDFKADKDVMKVAGEEHYKALKIKAVDAGVHIESMQVVYANGTPDDVPIRYDFKRGEESRQIDLAGKDRNIKEISFVYRSLSNSRDEKAHIQIFGLQ
ncbi:MAG TPA: hypothetical protein VEV83_17300 [Parafilimonas sp.]|nr:hypothetical protein [Parafilimonas sp.]